VAKKLRSSVLDFIFTRKHVHLVRYSIVGCHISLARENEFYFNCLKNVSVLFSKTSVHSSVHARNSPGDTLKKTLALSFWVVLCSYVFRLNCVYALHLKQKGREVNFIFFTTRVRKNKCKCYFKSHPIWQSSPVSAIHP